MTDPENTDDTDSTPPDDESVRITAPRPLSFLPILVVTLLVGVLIRRTVR